MFRFLFYALLFVVMSGSVRTAAQTSAGLIAHYTFDAPNADDATSNHNDGTIFGSPKLACGVFGNALELDGAHDFVILFGSVNNAFAANDFTISIYFKPAVTAQSQGLLGKGDSCSAPRFFGVRVSTLQRYVEMKMRNGTAQTVSTATMPRTCWHHLVITRSSQQVLMYVDGELASKTPTTAALNIASNAPWLIGDHPCKGNSIVPFKGLIDDVRFYNRYLTASEVRALYAPIDKIATRDTVIYKGTSLTGKLTHTCALAFKWSTLNAGNTVDASISDPTAQRPILSPDTSRTYLVSITDDPASPNRCITTDTLRVTVVDPKEVGCGDILLPTAFTPNNDGLNDTYFISNPYAIEKLREFSIYDRWGSRVFTTTDRIAAWDGTVGGVVQNAGDYIYTLEYECGGSTKTAHGAFTLIR